MPRIRLGVEKPTRPAATPLVDRLVTELKSSRDSGQPVIYEHEFPSGKMRVTVVWDEWDHLALEERTRIILRAYESALGAVYRDRIALASGLTVPEAHAAGMLPFQIITARREGDPVTIEQCHEAMIQDGASILLSEESPQLRFATLEEAEASRKRLAEQLPGSEPVWVISRDVGKVEDWLDFS